MANPAQVQDLGSRSVDMGYEYPYAVLPQAFMAIAAGRAAGERQRQQKAAALQAQVLPSIFGQGYASVVKKGKEDIDFAGIPVKFGTDGAGTASVDKLTKLLKLEKLQQELDPNVQSFNDMMKFAQNPQGMQFLTPIARLMDPNVPPDQYMENLKKAGAAMNNLQTLKKGGLDFVAGTKYPYPKQLEGTALTPEMWAQIPDEEKLELMKQYGLMGE